MRLKSQKFFLQLMLSFAIVTIIPLCSFIYCNHQQSNIMQTVISDANNLILNEIAKQYDSKISDISVSLNYLLSSPEFSRLSYSHSIRESNSGRDIQHLMDKLTLYQNSSRSEIDFLIYFEKQDFVLTPSTSSTTLSVYHSLSSFKKQDLTYDEWREQLLSTPGNTILVSEFLDYFGNSPSLVLSQTINRRSETIHIYVSSPMVDITDLEADYDDIHLWLTTANGDVIYSSTCMPLLVEQDLSGSAYEEIVKGIDNKTYISTTISSEFNSIRYVLFTSADYYWAALNKSKLYYLISFFTAALICLGLMLFFTHRMYHPIKKIADKISFDSKNKNEIVTISQAVDSFITKEHSHALAIKHITQKVNCQAWRLYLQTGIDSPEDSFLKTFSDINERPFWMVCIQVCTPDEECLKRFQSSADFTRLSQFIIANVCGELFLPFSVTKLEDGMPFCYVIHPEPDEVSNWENCQENVLQTFEEIFIQKLGLPYAIVYTEAPFSAQELPEKYQLMVGMLGALSSTSQSYILKLPQLAEQKEKILHFKQLYHQPLYQAIQGNNREAYNQIIKTLSKELFPLYGHALQFFKVNFAEYLFYMSEALPARGGNVSECQWTQRIDDFFLSKDVICLEKQLLDIFDFISMEKSSTISEVQPTLKLVDAIKHYIENNYLDSNLNTNNIGYALDKNPQYISHVFATEMKISLTDYINNYRIDHACTLLRGDESIEAVSILSGFNNVRTFRRVFTKIKGVSPSQYRDLYH